MSEPKRVWVLSDGQPGHDSRSRGIVQALEKVTPVEARTLRVDLRMGLARNALRALLNRGRRPASLKPLGVFYRMDALPGGGCDLLVSAGGKTSFANAWIAAVTGAPNIFAGTLRRLLPDHFSVVMTLEPVPGAANNLVVPLLPSTIDAQRAATAGAALRRALGDGGDYWLMLLGGKGAGYRYRDPDWMRIARVMNALADSHGIRWLLATSRRTGPVGERILRRHIDAERLARACWSQAGDAFEPEALLGAAGQVFVSEDSMTMLTEAMSAQRPVYSLRPEQALPDSRYEQALRNYVDAGRLRRFCLADLAGRPEMFEARRYAPAQLPEHVLGRELARRLGWNARSS